MHLPPPYSARPYRGAGDHPAMVAVLAANRDHVGEELSVAMVAADEEHMRRWVRDRGMTEAALGVDTNNPGGAFQLHTSLGFELRSTEAVYTRPARA